MTKHSWLAAAIVMLSLATFARAQVTKETLPGVTGPPYGNGQDRSTTVGGTLTIIDSSDAVFRSQSGAVLHFAALPPAGCD